MKLNIINSIKPFLSKHQPEILTSMGISGLLFSIIWGVKTTIAATKLVEERKKELGISGEKIPFKEVVKTTWKLYLPVAVSTMISIPCIVAGNRILNKRNAVLAAAYSISETALVEYQEKTAAMIGEKKEKEIREAISKDNVNKVSENKVVITGDGDSLFYEPLSGRYFKSNWNKISKAANELNANAVTNITDYITLSEWYIKIGLEPTELSDELGWSLTSNGTKGLIDVVITAVIGPEDNPCGSLYYNNRPRPL